MKRYISFLISMVLIFSFLANFPKSVHGIVEEPVRIAIIDTGISSRAISNKNILEGRNYVRPNKSTEDQIGHGTAVAGIIVGSKVGGIEGLCPTAELVPLVYYSKAGEDKAVKGDLLMLAQIITLMWRALNCPDALGRSDLAGRLGEHYYTDAVAWADTYGLFFPSQRDFVPTEEGTRARLVTYLYQSLGLGY